jgi:hypothetical protein
MSSITAGICQLSGANWGRSRMDAPDCHLASALLEHILITRGDLHGKAGASIHDTLG